MESNAKTPRDKILEFMKDAPNYEELQQMPDDELRANYCEMMAHAADDGRHGRRAPLGIG
jgi:hypothetical protein